jgi:hypothetical protein
VTKESKIIIIDKKKAMATIMARRQHKDGSTTEAPMQPQRSTEMDGTNDPRHAAAQDMLAAFHENNPQKLMEAAANFHDLHRQHSETVQDTTPEVVSGPETEE